MTTLASDTTAPTATPERGFAPTDVRTLITRLVTRVPAGWWRLAAALALSVGATGASVALTGTSAWLLSRAAEHPGPSALLVAGTAVRTFGTIRGPFRYAERLMSHDVALRMQSALRLSTYDKLAQTTLLGSRRGDLLMRVTADVEAIMDVIVRVALPFCSAAVVLLGTSVLLSFFDPATAAALLTCSLVAGLVLPWLAQRWSQQADRASLPARGALADQVSAMTTAALDLVTNDAAEAQLAELGRLDARLRTAEARSAWTQGVAAGGQTIAMGVAVGAALVLGAQAVVRGDMPARDLAVLCLTPLALHESFADLTKAAQTLTRARAGLARVVELLTRPAVGSGDRVQPEVAGGTMVPTSSTSVLAEALPATDEGTVLVLDHLAIGWPDNPPVYTGIDLVLTHGERVAVTGPSGIGKTTLAATIMGLIPPAGGGLHASPRIGYLAQDAHIFGTTVAENVRLGNPHADDACVTAALIRAGAPHLALDRLIGEGGAQLSGGEARRVALARLLVTDVHPDLVILDEPTEHLDQETATALLDDLWAVLGDTTLLAITHDADLIARCERRLPLGA